ncbi:hypothetical protein GR138_29920 [Shinella kummerowiae]|uniref:Uncharacterized protein n=1 Tax=Shinella kummerowiae TaxID=417745 RepID=A0A6N8SJY1_9HYPH|nr:hypothetical protein [Shinella kummerowiae]MXN49415.1 hypothetical protein [Shinella kummerowiae]
MVDTEIPSITRRNLLSVAAASITASNAQHAGSTSLSLPDSKHSELVLLLWEEWFAAHKQSGELCRLQQGLETRLFELVRDLSENERDDARQAADKELGYSRACQAEAEATDREQALVNALWNTPARSIAGIIAKLHSVIEYEDPGDTMKMTPWPELRSILTDLVRFNERGRTI